MSKYRIGDQVLVKANNLGWDGEDYLVEIDGCSPVLVREDNIISYSQKTYEDGLKEAWEIAGKLLNLTGPEFSEIFPDILWGPREVMKHSPLELAEKIKAWEDGKEIRVGDIVNDSDGNKNVVTGISGQEEMDTVSILRADGFATTVFKKELTKTGRTVDVSSFLAEIGEGG